MFGLRSFFRSCLYDLRQFRPSRASRRLGRYVNDYYEYERLRLMAIMSREHKYLYMVNPKVASTSIRNLLHRLNGFDELDDPRDVMGHERSGFLMMRNLSDDEFCDILESPDYCKFTFVRNPFSRLVSGYVYFQDLLREKIDRGKRPFPYRVTRRRDPRRDTIPRRFLSFREFIEDICLRRDIVHDLHFRPQTEVLLTNPIRYDFIGRIESFEEDVNRLLTRLDAPAELRVNSGRVTNPSRKKKPVGEWFTDDLAEMVRIRFARDFETFSYDLEVPGAAPRKAA